MADIDFEVHGEPGAIAVPTYRRAMNLAFGVLADFDTGITGIRSGGLRWYIRGTEERETGGIVLRVYSKEKDILLKKRDRDPSPKVASAFVAGFDDLENRIVTPPYLSEFGMIKARSMAELIGRNGASGFSVSAEGQAVEVTAKTSRNIGKLLPTLKTAIGSIEGTLEKISVHRHPHFVVYHAISKRAITCEIADDQLIELAKRTLGERVIVSGTLQKNFKGETLRVRATRLRQLGRLHVMPPNPEWATPEFTDSETTADMLRRIRGA